MGLWSLAVNDDNTRVIFHHRPQFTSVSLMLLLPCCFRVKKLHDVRNDWNVIFGKPLKSIHVVLKNPKYKGVDGSKFKSTFNFAYLSVIWWRQPIDCCIYFLARSGEKMIKIFALGLPPADHHVFPCQDLLKTSFSGAGYILICCATQTRVLPNSTRPKRHMLPENRCCGYF